MTDGFSDWQISNLLERAESDIVAPLHENGWTCRTERAKPNESHVLITAEQNGCRHVIALFDEPEKAWGKYQQLPEAIDLVLFTTNTLDKATLPVSEAGQPQPSYDFFAILLEWNRECWPGKMAPDLDITLNQYDDDAVDSRGIIKSENPNAAVWLRLGRLQSVKLAAKAIAAHGQTSDVNLSSDVVEKKAAGVAFAVRNAADYYKSSDGRNLSQRILNLYYGTLSFAIAEMIARPDGPIELADVENATKQGHGLYTVDGPEDGVEDLTVGLLKTGFFAAWMRAIGTNIDHAPAQKAKRFTDLSDLHADCYVSLEHLFSRIPEIGDLYQDIFDSPSLWLRPFYVDQWNNWDIDDRSRARTRTYGVLVDAAGRMTKEQVAAFPFGISEIRQIQSQSGAAVYKVAFEHDGKDVWWKALPIHRSPLSHHALIMPTLGTVQDYRAICFIILYALSIVVRYRPSLWRRVQEGDLDQFRVLIETFLVAVERLLPQHFLGSITGQEITAGQPGTFR